MKSRTVNAAQALERIGFTALEAAVYVNLLREGPATGYRVAQLVGKAVANTYKALEALEERGVVACDDGEVRIYRPLPYARVSEALASDFSKRMSRAANLISALDETEPDERIYRLSRADHVYERAAALAANAQKLVMIDARRAALEPLMDDLRAAAARGIRVAVLTYAPIEIPGARVVLSHRGGATSQRWPGEPLHLNADGSAALIARLTDDGEAAGLWTESTYIAWTLYCGLASEMAESRLNELGRTQPDLPLPKALADANEYTLLEPPGDLHAEGVSA